MRLRELTLDAFGQFSGRRFDFGEGGGGSDFHIIHGPNEAGKTTMMEAYIRLLYGFPHREPYDFLHQRKNLKVSGVFEVNGRLLHLTRLPTRTCDLVDENGNPLPEQAIAAHLGGLSERDYRNLLCLDDNTIEAGGEEIANARGEIGRLLFSAAAGIANLSQVLEEMRAEADGIYRKRASRTRMAELKRQLEEIDRQIRERDVSASRWRALKSALANAAAEERAAREERDRIRRELERARVMKRALPWLAEHDRLAREVEPYADFPRQLDIDPEELLRLEKRQERLVAEVERLRQERAAAGEELRAITVDPDRIALGEELENLDQLRSRMQTAELDLPKRRRELEDVMNDMRHSARELGAREGTDPTRLVLTAADLDRLQAARDELLQARTARETAAGEHGAAARRRAEAQAALRLLEESGPQIRGLDEIFRRHAIETLAPKVTQAKAELRHACEEAENALTRLSHGTTRFTELPPCPMAPDMARALAEEHAQLKEQLAAAEREREGYLRAARAKSARLERLAAHGAVIPDEKARAAREERDALWQAHLQDLTRDSAEAFERAMRKVDEIAEARLVHANELAEVRQLELDRSEAQASAEAAKRRIADLKARMEEIEGRISGAAASIGLDGITPAGLVDWLERHRAASEAWRRVERIEDKHGDVLRKAEELTRLLAARLDLESPSFETALAAARRAADEERQAQERLRQARQRLQERERIWRERAERLKQAEAALQAAQRRWQALVTELFGDAVAAEAALNGLQHLRDLREQDRDRRQLERRIRDMESDQHEFTRRMKTLAQRHEVEEESPLAAFARLGQIADMAKRRKERGEELVAHIREVDEQIRGAERQLQDIERSVRRHARAFPSGVEEIAIEALRRMVEKAQEIIEKRKRIAELEDRICAELGVPDITAARELLAGLSAADLEARIGGHERDLEQAEARLVQATEARVNAERDLAAVSSEADVALLIQRRNTILAEMEQAALDFLQLDLGLALAEEAIRRYRDSHRSAMMEATERAFHDLTNGAYTALRTHAEGEREVLIAIARSGASKRVADLSKGTRFQLYLALRAAAYEQMVEQGVCLPFFCDDVFETFDEERTRAACRLMERIGRRGQAIYLTHHRHVVEIAQEVCTDKPRIHNLAS